MLKKYLFADIFPPSSTKITKIFSKSKNKGKAMYSKGRTGCKVHTVRGKLRPIWICPSYYNYNGLEVGIYSKHTKV